MSKAYPGRVNKDQLRAGLGLLINPRTKDRIRFPTSGQGKPYCRTREIEIMQTVHLNQYITNKGRVKIYYSILPGKKEAII